MERMPSFDMVLFGGTGDLAKRKLLPALFAAHCAGLLNQQGRILATGSHPLSRHDYINAQPESLRKSQPQCDEATWQTFIDRIDYLQLKASENINFENLRDWVQQRCAEVVVCYLATAPKIFIDICSQLARVGLNQSNVRVVLEKPLGHDLESCESINASVAEFFNETQIYRIDHYLGKESVQNLMAIRFGNTLFEPLWRREWIRDVQITIAEELGVEKRGDFYDHTGALRDMVQNHLLQLLCMVAMEPPTSLGEDAIRDEKLKVLKSLHPITSKEASRYTVRGQYEAGNLNGSWVPGYLQESGIAPHSQTETFVALKAEVANWRWAGVPFYLRTGKRMPKRLAEIVIHFHPLAHVLFPQAAHQPIPQNRLVIQLQPEESIRLQVWVKQPGDSLLLEQTSLDLNLADATSGPRADAYQRLLIDVIRGKLGLFMRRDEQAQAWRWVGPILQAWAAESALPEAYSAGTWGPCTAHALLAREGAAWYEGT